mmetsp:Transcript_40470/g.93983  ORF Transcript_40470/g.93983 Transcript_40470/m.93983 type:complete len:306 (+) Transcript_40470:154-1071(+)
MIEDKGSTIRLSASVTEDGQGHAEPLVVHCLQPETNCDILLGKFRERRQHRVLGVPAVAPSIGILRQQADVIAKVPCEEISAAGRVDGICVLTGKLAEDLIFVLGARIGLRPSMAPDLAGVHPAPRKQAVVFCEIQKSIQEDPRVSVRLQEEVKAEVGHRIADAFAHLARELLVAAATPAQDSHVLLRCLVRSLRAKEEEVLDRPIACAPAAAVGVGVDVLRPRLSNRIHPLPVALGTGRHDHEQVIMRQIRFSTNKPLTARVVQARPPRMAPPRTVDRDLDRSTKCSVKKKMDKPKPAQTLEMA